MTYYGPKQIAASFRTVRDNTLKIAEEIPEDQYGFSPAPGARTIAQTLIHISNVHKFMMLLGPTATSLEGINFMEVFGPIMADEQKSYSKAEIIAKLKAAETEYSSWIEALTEERLGETVTMPTGGTPPSRTRFDMVISVKEHEMHHRGQLMVAQRMIGLVPHLTRQMMERFAAMQAQSAQKA